MAQLTLAEADTIIVILLFVVLLLLILGSISLYYNSVFKRRNEQLHRILDALDDYRAIVGVGELSLDEQEEAVMKKQSKLKAKAVKAIPTGEGQSFFVKMDARINKEKPFKDPYFDQKSLAEFMENWYRVIRIPTERLSISTPYEPNTLQRCSWNTWTTRWSSLPVSVALRIQQHSTALSSSPLASRQRSI